MYSTYTVRRQLNLLERNFLFDEVVGVGEDFDELFDDVFNRVEGTDGLVHTGDTLANLFGEGGEVFIERTRPLFRIAN